jgi:BON domain
VSQRFTRMVASDRDIKCRVEAELRRSPHVEESRIAVRVIGGAVTLTGWVDKHFHRYEVEDAVKRVAGVSAIANDIPRVARTRDLPRWRYAVAASQGYRVHRLTVGSAPVDLITY